MTASTNINRKKTTKRAPRKKAQKILAETKSDMPATERTHALATIASQILLISDEPDPRTIPRPAEDEFFITHENWALTLTAIIHGMPLLVVGPAGCGKTELICRAAKAIPRRKLKPFNFGGMTEPRTALIGTTHFFQSEGTVFVESRFVQALRERYSCILLDELSRAPQEAQNLILTLLDEQRYIALDEKTDVEIVHPAEGVSFCATMNVGGEYTGTDNLDWAIQNRFQVVINMDFMDTAQEVEVLKRRCPGIKESDANRLAKAASKQRLLYKQGEYSTGVSTRSLLSAGKLCENGFSVDTAFKFCIQNHYSSVGGLVSEREKLAEIFKFS